MENKFGITTYLPGQVGNPREFLKNVRDFPPKHPHFIFTDTLDEPGLIKLNGNVEIARTEKNKMAVANTAFFIALRIAANNKLTHLMILEEDCRVGCPGWDDIVWQEFLSKKPDAICGGTIVCFNPCSYNQEAARSYEKLVHDNYGQKAFPFAMTGTGNLAEQRDSCVFPNAALAIYRMDWLLKTFPEALDQRYIETAQKIRTFDYEIGIRLWSEFKEKVYDKVVQLNSIYSGYGNILTTEEERQNLLTNAESGVVAVHQIKSKWTPQVPEPIDLMPVQAPVVVDPPTDGVAEKTGELKLGHPKVELFIVTYAKDFDYLKLCLKSVALFCKGFSGLTILVPNTDFPEARALVDKFLPSSFVKVRSGREWNNKGMLWAMCQKCFADTWCPDADFICHIDADCVFYKPVTPNSFFDDGKPILRYESFSTLALRNANIFYWKVAAEDCLPFSCPDEGMRSMPLVYHSGIYKATRDLVEAKKGKKFDSVFRSGKNSYPQNPVEFPMLSAVVLERFRDLYSVQDCARQENPDLNPFPVFQAWSHSPLDKEQTTWFEGRQIKLVPKEFVKQFGID